MTGLRIVFAGTPEFAVAALRALMASRHVVVGVLTQPDRPSGRGQKLTASAVKQVALERRLEIAQPTTLKTEEGRAALVGWQPDVLVVVAYGLILPREVLTLPRLGCVNIHASLLPRWRGAAPIQRAILAGDEESGITIMQMDVGLDTGPMLLQKQVRIAPEDTSGSLHDRLAQLGATALLEALDGIEQGTIQPRPQPAEGVTYAAKIEKAEALIDWNQDAESIERKVRAFHPWPIAETRLGGEQLRITKARLSQGFIESQASENDLKTPKHGSIDSLMSQSGSIIGLQEGAMRVRCGRGSLDVLEVQRPGKRPVAARDLLHACDVTGQRLG